MLARAAAQAGIERRVVPHQLRHAHAAELVAAAVPMPVIRDQLGHSSLAVTDRYLRTWLPPRSSPPCSAASGPSRPPMDPGFYKDLAGRLYGLLIDLEGRMYGDDAWIIHEFIDRCYYGLALEEIARTLTHRAIAITGQERADILALADRVEGVRPQWNGHGR